jgi:hypothetical protein
MAASAATPSTMEDENSSSRPRLLRVSRHAIRHVHGETSQRQRYFIF